MATRTFTRRPRLYPDELPTDEFVLEPPPEMPRPEPLNLMTFVLPGAMIVMVGGFIVIGGFNPASLMMGSMMLITTIGMLGASGGNRESKAQLIADRNDYLKYMRNVRQELRTLREDQRSTLLWTHPEPSSLWSLVGTRRMWERRTTDDDFTQVRVGLGSQALTRPLRAPQTGPVDEVDPICATTLRSMVRANSTVDDLPIAVRLDSFPVVEFNGSAEAARGAVRSLLCQAATLHGPDTLHIAAVAGGQLREEWDWLKWLPHNRATHVKDSLGPVRMVGSSLEQVDEWLGGELSNRPRFSRQGELGVEEAHVIVVVDGAAGGIDPTLLGDGLLGVTVIDLSGSLPELTDRAGLQLEVDDEDLYVVQDDEPARLGRVDRLTATEASSLVRAMAAYRLSDRGEVADDGTGENVEVGELTDLLGLGDPAQITADAAWKPRSNRDLLRAPIGVGPGGEVVELDIKESALGGMGPHGLVIGATGSGKSELLRTLVLALGLTHSPEQLNLVLIDFKGGATFAGLQDLPHVAAVITNLEDDLGMVDRMYDALSGEMNRRQELLRAAGSVVNIREYAKARASLPPSPDLPVLPSLFVVCDEFSELLSQKPDFAELFVAIGRLGRSMGIHLLLASQRLEEGKLRGLDSHLSYRIGLKTFSAGESRAVLGVPDAYDLPSVPGVGYLKFDTTTMSRFKAYYVSGPYSAYAGSTAGADGPGTRSGYLRPVSFVSDVVEIPDERSEEEIAPEVVVETPAQEKRSISLLEVIVDQLSDEGPAAHEVWLPPLEESPALDVLYPPLTRDPERGVQVTGGGYGLLRPALGVVDLPYEQRRDPLVVDFSGGAGHGIVVGGPQSGKSTALRTMVSSLALTHTPREVQMYIVDLGGGSLAGCAGLPHVGGVAQRSRPDYVRRMIAEVATVLADREHLLTEYGAESMADYRRLQRSGQVPFERDAFGDVFLFIDGWGQFREEFEDLESKVTTIAGRGLSYGIHVVLSSMRWMEVRPAIKDAIGTRIELRLGDPSESEFERKIAQLVPQGRPGRGLTPAKKHLLIGLPRTDSDSDPDTLTQGFSAMVKAVAEAWTGPVAPPVRMLPDSLPAADLPAATRDFLPFGVNEEALAPIAINPEAEPFLLYFADGEMGKTSFLRVVAENIMASRTSAEARILLADYRRTMLGAVPPEYLAGYGSGRQQLGALLGDLIPLLQGRVPGPDVTAEQLRERSWWSGPDVFILVDDYDIVATGMDDPLTALIELLPQARDIGLHLIITRRTSGASRAMYGGLVQPMRDLGAVVFVGNGPKEEGVLAGTAKPSDSLPPGRGYLVTRKHGTQLVQIAHHVDAG